MSGALTGEAAREVRRRLAECLGPDEPLLERLSAAAEGGGLVLPLRLRGCRLCSAPDGAWVVEVPAGPVRVRFVSEAGPWEAVAELQPGGRLALEAQAAGRLDQAARGRGGTVELEVLPPPAGAAPPEVRDGGGT